MENLLVILQVTIKLGFFVWFAVLFCIVHGITQKLSETCTIEDIIT